MPKKFNSQGGALPILILLAALGFLGFLLISNTFDFRDALFNRLFPKPPSEASQKKESVPGEIVVKFKPAASEKIKQEILNSNGLTQKDNIPEIGAILLKVPEAARDKVLEALKKNPNLEYAALNYLAFEASHTPETTSNDPVYYLQWNLKKIGAPAAWDISTGKTAVGNPIVVAVLDTGINDTTNPELIGKTVPGWNFVDGNNDTTDPYGHGTKVAGVVAAKTNNSLGVASLARDSKIMPLRVIFPNGGVDYFTMGKAIIYAVDNGAKAINISWAGAAGTSDAPYAQDAINYAFSKDVVIAAASGNFGQLVPYISFPASANNVIAVGSSNADDTMSPSSSYGLGLDVVAPGEGIWTTVKDEPFFGGPSGGTSFASPHVAALAALIFSANPGLKSSQVVDIIKRTANDLGDTGWDIYHGWGRIDAGAALTRAKYMVQNPGDSAIPIVAISLKRNITSNFDPITIDASDDIGITKVEYYIDGNLAAISNNTAEPYTIPSNTPLPSEGTHTMSVKAYDNAENIGISKTVDITFDYTPPSVSITNPQNNQTISGTVTLSVSVQDNTSVATVFYFADKDQFDFSEPKGNITNVDLTPFTYSWDTTASLPTIDGTDIPTWPNGTYTLVAMAMDFADNKSFSIPLTITIYNEGGELPTPTSSPIFSPTPTSTSVSRSTPTPLPTSAPTPTPTPTSTPTTNSVVISNISSTTTETSATIKWTTNLASSSKVDYGLTSNLGSSTLENTNLTTSHSVFITGLTKATKYYFKVYSKNSAGLETSSSIQQFRTKNK